MRVAHVVTQVSADGAFGGPLSVARGQAVELARRGHDVTVLAGWDGSGTVDTEGSAVKVQLFRTRRVVGRAGFSGLVAPGLSRVLRHGDPFDVVHLHQGRDLVTLAAGTTLRRRNLPYVIQTHGMVMPDDRLKARLADALVTRRLLAGAGAVLALTEVERAGLRHLVGPSVQIRLFPNGVTARSGIGAKARVNAVPDVLFCARLHPRKRVAAFVGLAAELARRGVDATFSVVGSDAGDLKVLRDEAARLDVVGRISYEGALSPDAVGPRLRRADVYVLPSVDEPFPMTVLEAMSEATPVVITRSCAIAEDLEARGAASVTDGTVTDLADAVERLLSDSTASTAQSLAGRAAVRDAYSIKAVVDELERVYDAARRQAGPGPT